MKKIALAVISRDTKEDAALLKNLLENTKGYVDGFFITAAHSSFDGYVKKVCEEYGAHYSEFKWIYDFSAARNFNFSQVTKDYDYIMWSDIDDTWRGLEKLKDFISSGKDAFAFWYLYAFDEDRQPTVVHKKTMIIKNDGSFEWKGKIHEDLLSERQIDIGFSEDIHRIHETSEERIDEARYRNLEIAQKDFEEHKEDPRNHFNYANSLSGVGQYEEAIKVFELFLEESGSKEEKYVVLQRLGWNYHLINKEDRAVKAFQLAIGMEPTFPDAYLELGKLFFENKNFNESERYTKEGLTKTPSYKAIMVFNPRDYDYNPIHLLAKIYFAKNRPDMALKCVQNCLKINPNPRLKAIEKELSKEMKILETVTKEVEKMKEITDLDVLKSKIDSLDPKYRSHPGICMIRNKFFVKTESTGKDLVIYCGITEHEWNPELFRTKGFGGSEEAIIHLSKEFAKKGMNVSVYANVGPQRITEEGVEWIPYWEFNHRDKIDFLILWRSPKMCDYELNAGKVFIDLHDTVNPAEFTAKRLEKINKIFVKTKAHRFLYPDISDDKFAIIPNGLKIEDFEGEYEKDENLIINTSSPDRSLSTLNKVFEKVKQQIPEARCLWAYGWELFETSHTDDKRYRDMNNKVDAERERVGIMSLGKVPQSEVAELYKKAKVLLYPSEFYEIDCISVKKAQLAGCKVVSTDFAALNESIQFGTKIHSKKDKTNWAVPYQIDYSADETLIDEFVSETVKALREKTETKEMREWAKKFDWGKIANNWYDEIYAS